MGVLRFDMLCHSWAQVQERTEGGLLHPWIVAALRFIAKPLYRSGVALYRIYRTLHRSSKATPQPAQPLDATPPRDDVTTPSLATVRMPHGDFSDAAAFFCLGSGIASIFKPALWFESVGPLKPFFDGPATPQVALRR